MSPTALKLRDLELQFNLVAQVGATIDRNAGLPQALLTAALVAGFVAIIWFAAARCTTDIVSGQNEDLYGRKLFG